MAHKATTLVAATAVLLLAGCRREQTFEGGAHQPPIAQRDAPTTADDEPGRLAADGASMLASRFGLTSHHNIIELKAHTLGLAITVENDGDVHSKWAVGVRVQCVVDGRPTPSLVTGVVGMDESRDAALHNALETWVAEVGTALVPAIERRTPDHQSPKYDVYAGLAGIRGTTKPEHLDELNKRVFAVVEPVLDKLVPTPSLHVLAFALVPNPDGSIDGEFRVDGEISDRLARLAHDVRWPEAAEGYMLKQYYVLAPHESR